MKDKRLTGEIPEQIKHAHVQAMAENLPMLRARLGLTQEELGNRIGLTRQSVNAMESGGRQITWGSYLSFLFVFQQNETTRLLLPLLGIYTAELEAYFRVTDLQYDGLAP